MSDITSSKVLIGSLYKHLQKASIYGRLELKYLYLYDIISGLLYDCPTCISFKQSQKLQDLLLQIQNTYPDICKYRESKTIYTNIIGCKDCDPNNSPLQVINTAPVITDPEPEVPDPKPPYACGYTIRADRGIPSTVIPLQAFISCYNDENSSPYKYIKIVTVPSNGQLFYDTGAPITPLVTAGLVIDATQWTSLKYFNVTGYPDSFTFEISNSQTPAQYSNTQTIIVTNE